MPREPFSHADELAQQTAELSAQQRKQIVLDYKNTFAGERGQRVLADLNRLFGFNKPSGAYGMSHGDVMLREGMKMPLWHIQHRLEETFAPKRRGKSASTTAPQ